MKLVDKIRINDFFNKCNNISYKISGSLDVLIGGLNDYQVAQEDDITWIDYEPLYNKAFLSDAKVIIINKLPEKFPVDKVLVVTENPLLLFNTLLENANDQLPKKTFLQQYFKKKYITGKNCKIYKGVKIGNNVVIGDGCTIYPNVVIYDNVIVGDNVIIHANSVLGADPFAYIKQSDDSYFKRKPYGRVIVLDNVEIGALCTVDKGITSDTIIGYGTKTDNHVHIGHDVWIGSNCFFSGQVAIAGYVRIKNNCTFWGKSGVISSLSITNNTTVLASSIVFKDVIIENQNLFGIPAVNSIKYWKNKVRIKKILSE